MTDKLTKLAHPSRVTRQGHPAPPAVAPAADTAAKLARTREFVASARRLLKREPEVKA